MNLYWIELKRFLKRYYKLIISLAFLIAVLFTGLMYLVKDEPLEEEDPVVEENADVFQGDSRPAYFRFYIEQPDGSTYTNGATVDELFNLEEMYERASESTGVDLFSIEEEVREQLSERNTEIDTEEEFTPVSVAIDTSSNIFTAIIATGNNEDNIEVANFYNDYLFNEGFEILDNNLVYTIESPQLSEPGIKEDNELEESNNQTQKISIKDIIIDSLIGLVIGFMLSIGLFYVKELFSRKLNYSFTYNTGNPDYFELYDSKIKNKEFVRQFIGIPHDNNKVLLSQVPQNTLVKDLLANSTNHNDYGSIIEYNSLLESTLSTKIDEIIIIVLPNETDRKWFNEQIELSKLRRVPIKIIQINS